jgi:hypothetical protein
MLALQPAPRRPCLLVTFGPAEPIGTFPARGRRRTNPISPARSRRLRRANSAPVSLVALTRAEQRRYDRAPLMRFRPLQRLPVRDALVRSSHAPTDPASAFSQAPARPRVRGSGSSGARRPCGFPPCEHDAVKLDVRTLLVAGLAQFERAAVDAAAKRCIAMSATSSIVSAGADRCIRCPARSEATRQHQAPPLRSFAARNRSCIAAYLRAMFRYRFEPSRPGRTS